MRIKFGGNENGIKGKNRKINGFYKGEYRV